MTLDGYCGPYLPATFTPRTAGSTWDPPVPPFCLFNLHAFVFDLHNIIEFLLSIFFLDPDATYTSFSNPNYLFSRAHHHHSRQHASNDSCSINGNTSGVSVEKLSLSSDLLDTHGGAFSDYSSCEPTPTSPDRSLILQRLHSLSDDDDTDDDIETDAYGESVEGEKVPEGKSDSDSDGSNSKEEPRIYFGVGSQECRRSRGILGYLEMLEKQALKREARKANGSSRSDDDGDDNDNDEDRDDEDESDSPKTMNGGDSPIIPPRIEK